MNHKSQPIKLNPEYGCELYKKLPEDGKEIFVEYRKKIKTLYYNCKKVLF